MGARKSMTVKEFIDFLRKASLEKCVKALTGVGIDRVFCEPEQYDELIALLREKKRDKRRKIKLLTLYEEWIMRPPYNQKIFNTHFVVPLEDILKELGTSASEIASVRDRAGAPRTTYVTAKYPTMIAEGITGGAPGLGKHGRGFTVKARKRKD